MEHLIIGMLVSMGLNWLRSTRHGAKLEKAIKTTAAAIQADPGNPINTPKDAIAQAIILHNQDEIERMAADLDQMQADAKRDEEAAIARGKATAQGMDITIVDPHDGTESKP